MAKNIFTDYDGFVDKFKPQKTTDDCYTPDWCYDIVLDYVNNNICPLDDKRIVRPFWPGADYESLDYRKEDVVIDNPPFSIISKICNFYHRHRIPFFLFAPQLTLGSCAKDLFTAVVCSAKITYQNGAVVSTSFVTNMMPGNPAIVVDGTLADRLNEGNRVARLAQSSLPVYELPDNVVTSALLGKIATAGGFLRIERHEAAFTRCLDSQRKEKKGLFGGGWLISNNAAQRQLDAIEHAKINQLEREQERKRRKKVQSTYWSLSPREKSLIDCLDLQSIQLAAEYSYNSSACKRAATR